MLRVAQFIPLKKLPRNLGFFDYKINAEIAGQLEIGDFVKIPFGQKEVWGCFCGFIRESAFENIKGITKIEKMNLKMDKFRLKFLHWFSEYYYYSLGSTLKLMQPEPLKRKSGTKRKDFTINFSVDTSGMVKSHKSAELLAKKIIRNKDKKYWLEDFDIELKQLLYIQLMRETNKQVFFFFPDVGSANKFFKSMPNEFRERACLITSKELNSKGKTFKLWEDIQNQTYKIVVGTRSALFYLNTKTDLIIADQIDADDYKQWDQQPYYNTLNCLEKIQELLGNRLIFSSTNPPIESMDYMKKGGFQYVPLGKRTETSLTIVDMKAEPRRKFDFLSYIAEQKIEKAINNNQQVLLIVNKTGLFSRIKCDDCGHVFTCPKCQIPFSISEKNELICHQCKTKENIPLRCPHCQSVNLQGRGPGIDYIEKQLSQVYSVSYPKDNKRTQIIISTGHDIVTSKSWALGCIIFTYFDNLLSLIDYNASYRTYKFLRNVIDSFPSVEVIIQTYLAKNETIKIIGKNYAHFFQEEMKQRKEYLNPPFCKVIKLFFQHHDEKICANEAGRMFQALVPIVKMNKGSISEPYLYYLNKIRKRFRYIIVIKSPEWTIDKEKEILQMVPDFWSIDKDPLDLL